MKWIDVILAVITLGVYTIISVGTYRDNRCDEFAYWIGCTMLTSFLFLFTLRAVLGFRKK